MPTSTLTATGQVTIPEEIRRHLGLRAGDQLRFELHSKRAILVQPEEPDPKIARSRLPGLLSHLAKSRPVTVEEMDEAIGKAAEERFHKAVKR